MKELFIIRHAKSSWEDGSLSDFDRPLNDRGKTDAPLIGKSFQDGGIVPDLIISSPAKRAISTARIIASKVGYAQNDILQNKDIYEASCNTLLDIVNQIDAKYNSVFVFGHNPGFTYLAEKLSGEHIGNLPTCGVVGLRFEFDSWDMLLYDTGTQFHYDYPKRHK